MQDRPARWYFYMANAHMGLGNDVAALNYAQQAVSRDPNNLDTASCCSACNTPARPIARPGGATVCPAWTTPVRGCAWATCF